MTLTTARERRGWSFHEAAAHMNGVTEQQLRNLERIGSTRKTEPLNVRLGTALEILRVYHPDVSLDDFAGEKTLFRLEPTRGSRRALREWGQRNYYAAGAVG